MKVFQLKKSSLWLFVIGIALFAASCKNDPAPTPTSSSPTVDTYSAKVVRKWNEKIREVERYAVGYRPCPIARAMGYIGLATYESAVAGMKDNKSLSSYYPSLVLPKVENGQAYHWPTVVNACYASMARHFFPKDVYLSRASASSIEQAKIAISQIDILDTQNNVAFASELSPETYNRSKTYGLMVAEAVWNWSKTDVVGHDAYLDPFSYPAGSNSYTSPVGPGLWKPASAGARAMFPYWEQVRTFAINSDDKICRSNAKQYDAYSEDVNSGYYAQALEVKATPNADRAHMGEFWSDDLMNLTFSPPLRFFAIADQITSETANDRLDLALLINAKLGIGGADAAVACWASKYRYNVERPVTYIKEHIDPNWKTRLHYPSTPNNDITPSFPAYPSGHSTFGAVGASVLENIFPEIRDFGDNCHNEREDFNGKTRFFRTFYDAAREDAESRIWLGVHWRMDCEEGLKLGYDVGRRVNALNWKK